MLKNVEKDTDFVTRVIWFKHILFILLFGNISIWSSTLLFSALHCVMCIVPCIRVDMRYILHPPSVQEAMIGRHSNVSGNLSKTIWEILFIWFWLENGTKWVWRAILGPADNLNCWIFMEKYFDAHITISIHLECSAGWLSMRTCDVQLHLFAIHSSWQWRSMRAKLLTIPICKRA